MKVIFFLNIRPNPKITLNVVFFLLVLYLYYYCRITNPFSILESLFKEHVILFEWTQTQILSFFNLNIFRTGT